MICFQPYIRYAVFSDRARRLEFWTFTIVDTLLYCIFWFIDGLTGTLNADGWGLLSTIFFFGALLPRLAVLVRRLHDLDHSGWWLLLIFFPIIGWLWFLVLMLMKGTSGDNRYGPDSLERSA